MPITGVNNGPSGYTPSPNLSRPNSYRLSYTGPGITPPRAFPPSAFVGPAVGPDGIPFPDAPPSSSQHGSNLHYRRSSDEAGIARSGQIHRVSSVTSFAPPPAPWMRGSSWHESEVSVSDTGRALKRRSVGPSTLLKGPVEKPWLKKRDPWATASWWFTVGLFIVGVLASAVLCFFSYRDIPRLGNLCLVMQDNFDNLDTNTWSRVVELGGMGTGDFGMCAASHNFV